jgi:geranylgeranyl diphosphate synthase type II
LRNYAAALGLAFQIADDLLDVEQTTEQLGKRSHKDRERGKATYPSLVGIEASRAMAYDLARQATDSLTSFDRRAQPLRKLAEFAVERKL